MRKLALNSSPGSTVCRSPVMRALVGAVIGSKQINDWPSGAYTWAYG